MYSNCYLITMSKYNLFFRIYFSYYAYILLSKKYLYLKIVHFLLHDGLMNVSVPDKLFKKSHVHISLIISLDDRRISI